MFFWPYTYLNITTGHREFVKECFIDFLRNIYEQRMKIPWKSCHPFSWVYRVFCILKQLKTILQSFLLKKFWKVYSVAKDLCKTNEENCPRSANIFGYRASFSKLFSARITVRSSWSFCIPQTLYTQQNGWLLFIDFSFFAHWFFNDNLWHFSLKLPWGYVEQCTMYKVKNKKLPLQNARTRVRLL